MPFSPRSSVPDPRSLLDTRQLTFGDIQTLFDEASKLERHNPGESAPPFPKIVALVFFEPSTRTRMSFQMAAYRLGHRVMKIDAAGSSLVKGETYTDTILNIVAMGPDAIVVRYGKSEELDALLPYLKVPVVNAGSGTAAHPTQALLDAYTIQRERGSLKGQRVLIVGDIVHSRVAHSNFDVLTKMGAEVGVFGPEGLLPKNELIYNEKAIEVFKDGDSAAEWASVYMGLRVQLERHDAKMGPGFSMEDFHERFGLSRGRLQKLAKDAMILHPGPINHGVEFAPEVLDDPRCHVLDQVANGVLIRAAILARVFARSETTGMNSKNVKSDKKA